MVREERPVPSTPSFGLDASAHVQCDVGVSPSSPWFNSGGPPQFVKTHGATPGQQGAEPEARIHYGDIMDALHSKDQDALMNALTALLTARRIIGTSLDDASAPSKGSFAAPVDVVLAPTLDDAGVAFESSSRAQAARTTSRLVLVRHAARRGTTRAFDARADGAGRDALSTSSTFSTVDDARETAVWASTRVEAPPASSNLLAEYGRADDSITVLFDLIGYSITGLEPCAGRLLGGMVRDDEGPLKAQGDPIVPSGWNHGIHVHALSLVARSMAL